MRRLLTVVMVLVMAVAVLAEVPFLPSANWDTARSDVVVGGAPYRATYPATFALFNPSSGADVTYTYDAVRAASPNLAHSQLCAGNMNRVRASGTITAFGVFGYQTTSQVAKLQFRLFRYRAASTTDTIPTNGTFDEVGTAPAVVVNPAIVANQWYWVPCNIEAKAGDLIYMAWEQATGTEYPFGTLDVTNASLANNRAFQIYETYGANLAAVDKSGRGVDFFAANASDTQKPIVACKMKAPTWAMIGDSISMGPRGTNLLQPLVDDRETPSHLYWSMVGVSNTVPALLEAADPSLFGSILHHAMGGASAVQWAKAVTGHKDLVTSHAINYGPQAALIWLGINDILTGTSTTDYIAAMTDIITNLQTASITPVILNVPPYHGGTAGQKAAVLAYNAALATYCQDNGILLIDTYSLLNDPAAPGSLKTRYRIAADNVHPNMRAKRDVVAEVVDRVRSACNGSEQARASLAADVAAGRSILNTIAAEPAKGIAFVRDRAGKANSISLKLTVSASYQRFCRSSIVASGQFHAPASNAGSVWLQGTDGSDIEISKGQSYTVLGVDISQLQWKGTPNDVVTFLGGTW